MVTRQLLLTFIVATFINFGITASNAEDRKNHNNEAATKAEVELFIVCDKEFSERFDYNRQKLIDYWAVYMWDVNMRFTTLPSVDISFRVTSLLIINETINQPFIEETRSENGTISLNGAWENFRKWAYSHDKNVTAFDLALLVTGAPLHENETLLATSQSSSSGTACLKNDTAQINLSSIALHVNATWGHTCGALEAALAWTLGAKDDKDTDCTSDQYLMSTQGCNKRQYMFSSCSDAAIAEFVGSENAHCLKHSHAKDKNVLKGANVTHPPSLDEQCAMFTNNKNATADKDDNRCILTTCSDVTDGNSTFLWKLSPVDNSPCDEEKVCFRGRCLPKGFLLRNLENGKCLQHSKDRLALGDYLEMADCPRFPTPLNQFRVFDNGHLGTFLITPIVIPDMSSVQPEEDECLSVDLFDFYNPNDNLQYSSCWISQNYLGWSFIRLDGSTEMLLYHRETEKCAGVSSDESESGVKVYDVCDYNNKRMRWTFVKRPVVSLGWFNATGSSKNLENVTNTLIEHKTTPGESQKDQETENSSDRKFLTMIIVGFVLISVYVVVIIGCIITYYWKKGASDKVHYYKNLQIDK